MTDDNILIAFLDASDSATNEAMDKMADELLCKDRAKWIRIDRTRYDDMVAVSFHSHPLVRDKHAAVTLLSEEELIIFAERYGGALQRRLQQDPPPAIFVACEYNLDVLRSIVMPDHGCNRPAADNIEQFNPR